MKRRGDLHQGAARIIEIGEGVWEGGIFAAVNGKILSSDLHHIIARHGQDDRGGIGYDFREYGVRSKAGAAQKNEDGKAQV